MVRECYSNQNKPSHYLHFGIAHCGLSPTGILNSFHLSGSEILLCSELGPNATSVPSDADLVSSCPWSSEAPLVADSDFVMAALLALLG